MDDSRLKRNKHMHSRKGSKQEPQIIEWSFSSRSPSTVQAYMKNLQNIEQEKLFSVQRLDLTSIQQLSQRQTAKTRRNMTPSYVPDRNTPFEPSIVYADRSRNNSPSMKNKSPMSGRITPQPSEKPASRGLTRGQELYVRENNSDKHAQALQNAKLRRRGGSNPSCLASHSYYMSRNPNSMIKENRPDAVERNIAPDSVRFNQSKQVWGTGENSELSLSAFMSKRPPSAISSTSKKDVQQHVMREKKMNYVPQQQQVSNERSYRSKMEDSRLALADFSKYQSQDELRAAASEFEREFQVMGLTLKKESHSQKVYRDKSQEMNPVQQQQQFHTPMNKHYSGLVIENREVQKPAPVMVEERPLGTEEFYEDFFSMEKMTFNFEKTRVSKRPSHQKDYFTPEKTPVYANNSNNSNNNNNSSKYFSSREPQLVLSHRPNEGKSVRARYLE